MAGLGGISGDTAWLFTGAGAGTRGGATIRVGDGAQLLEVQAFFDGGCHGRENRKR